MFQQNNIYNKENTSPQSNNTNTKHFQYSNQSKRVDAYYNKIIDAINNKETDIFNIECSIYELTIDQYGSRLIQNMIECGTSQEKNQIFDKICDQILALSIDLFGNQSIQKFLEFGTKEQQNIITITLGYQAPMMSSNSYGYKGIQKGLEVLPPNLKVELAKSALKQTGLIKLATDQNGNHVVQKIIEKVILLDTTPTKENSLKVLWPLLSAFKGNLKVVSCHPLGCRVVQRLLETSPTEKLNDCLIDEMILNIMELCEDKYGNYVVQHVLVHSPEKFKIKIHDIVKDNLLLLSKHKFASNVVEKCITHGSEFHRREMLEYILDWPTRRQTQSITLSQMMKDMYANQVIQKAIEVASGEHLESLVKQIIDQSAMLKKVRYGRHIIGCVEKIYQKQLNK